MKAYPVIYYATANLKMCLQKCPGDDFEGEWTDEGIIKCDESEELCIQAGVCLGKVPSAYTEVHEDDVYKPSFCPTTPLYRTQKISFAGRCAPDEVAGKRSSDAAVLASEAFYVGNTNGRAGQKGSLVDLLASFP
jgi:hypothetical protein